MQFSTLALAALASLASAQTTGEKVIHRVTVGMNGTLTFSPSTITALVGEMVQFQFVAGNHTVTQSTFDAPCQPISQHSNITGFHSGFQPAAASVATGMIPTYTIMLNNTNPIWVYCAQGKHCESGMSMVINENTAANSSRSLTNYKALAAGATTVVPGGSAGTGTGSTGSTTGGTGSTTGGTTGTTTGGTGTGSTTDSATTGQPTSAAGFLSAPSVYMLLAAAAGASLFL
ncbi:Cupredoxin [Lasiosphaeria miniovina]|uniref:Cupredoxin n=1 Tax=Lasiosphaeria miniovina TaxID=1954250 RepID=A0AA39ZYL6_9PEZI|nr:Cupredoxin [Lasiosphaeria miniovina]KAK0706032.1 Cupredoxin [Lasiosphaeria miniovina]